MRQSLWRTSRLQYKSVLGSHDRWKLIGEYGEEKRVNVGHCSGRRVPVVACRRGRSWRGGRVVGGAAVEVEHDGAVQEPVEHGGTVVSPSTSPEEATPRLVVSTMLVLR